MVGCDRWARRHSQSATSAQSVVPQKILHFQKFFATPGKIFRRNRYKSEMTSQCRAVMEGPNPERKIKLMNNRSCLTIFTTILSVLACFAFSPQMQATVCPPEIPPPEGTDGAYPNFATAEGFAPLGAAGVPCTGL